MDFGIALPTAADSWKITKEAEELGFTPVFLLPLGLSTYDDDTTRVVILTGADGHFCAGGDVKLMRERRQTAAEGRTRVEALNKMVLRLVNFPRPTIAMVDGYAVGAGSNLALCCDLIVSTDDAVFGLPEVTVGIVPGGGGTPPAARPRPACGRADPWRRRTPPGRAR